MLSLLHFFCLFLLWGTGVGTPDTSLPYMVYLDGNQMVCLHWGFDDLQGDIEFQLTVNTTGWVGFGLSPNGNMIAADIVIGGMGPSEPYFTDRHGKGKFMPLVDDKQSYTLLSMDEKNGQTIMRFQRPIDTCDDQDFLIKLIYAYGITDTIEYHKTRRGTKEVNLLNYMPKTFPPNSKYLMATMDKITIPSVHTYYHCKVMKFSKPSRKQHIYRIEPVIEHIDMVHHLLLYNCPSFVNTTYDNMCYVFMFNAGIPFGDDDRDIYFKLEIHYNNPHLETGRTDSSGLKLYYTDQLRQHDVGVLMTGIISSHMPYMIPPKAQEFHTYGMGDPIPDLNVFVVLLHTHLAGRKVRVAQYRDGKQIDFLAVDEHYNFEMQRFKNVGKIKTIKQNDEIAVECTYDTMDRTNVTKMGLATTDEMCLAFIAYYPAINCSCFFCFFSITDVEVSNMLIILTKSPKSVTFTTFSVRIFS
uniref:Monooxygenase, DBH-like 1, like n=1 Tax=Cynoglossus semilaevis TaxID=244447 RepID=A0A3P8WZ46_CYNSE